MNNKQLNLLRMVLSAIEGVPLCLKVCEECETNPIIIGGQNIEEVREFWKVVKVLQSQSIWIGININILRDTNCPNVGWHSLVQPTLSCCWS